MGLSATQVTGSEKQGLGYVLVVDGKIWPAKISDPGTVSFNRNTLDATHSLTTNFKANKFEELADPITQDLTTFFDPTLADAFDIMGTAGATAKREIYLVFPRLPLIVGEVTRENGFIYCPEGLLAANDVAMPLDGLMTQSVNVNGGTANVTMSAEFDPTTALPATAITLGQVGDWVGPVAVGTIVATLTSDVDKTVDMSLFFSLGGADAALFELDGKYVKNVTQLTNATGTAGVHTLNVTTSNLVGYDEVITALQYEETGLTITIT